MSQNGVGTYIQQTSSSDDGQGTHTRNTPQHDSLQLLRCLQQTSLYLLKAWTRLFSSMWIMPE